MDIVVAMAILEFNKGSSGFISVLENLSIHSGHHFMIYISFIHPQAALPHTNPYYIRGTLSLMWKDKLLEGGPVVVLRYRDVMSTPFKWTYCSNLPSLIPLSAICGIFILCLIVCYIILSCFIKTFNLQ